MNLDERTRATAAVIERYRARPFSWTGRRTCLHLARAQIRAMGHQAPKIPDVRSALSAHRALNQAGHSSIEALLDSLLPRIAPAAMLVGDLALMKGEAPFDAIVICVGGKVFGYAEGHEGLHVIVPCAPFLGAWRL